MYLLDTNVISELRKIGDGNAHQNVLAWQAQIESDKFYLSSITIFELQLGVLRLSQRLPDKGRRLANWLDALVLPEFEKRILPVTTQIALRCAALHVPRNRPHNDALIAATALVHGMTIATRNVADLAPMGAPVVNPWESGA